MKSEKKNKQFPLFVSIPHSGIQIPDIAEWIQKIDPSVLMCDVDAYVDDLYRPVLKEKKVPYVFFEWHRYAVDVNRFATDVSEKTVEEAFLLKKEGKYKFKQTHSPSDVHWHETTKGDTLIKKPISQKIHKKLIKCYFDPFHKGIQSHIDSYKEQDYNNVYILDLHSMPSQALSFHRDQGETRKDIVISDNEGKSCSTQFRDCVIEAYQTAGFKVSLNWPYKGGAITQKYGQPHMGQHCLQIELNRKLYMDEKTKRKNANYKKVQTQLKKAMIFILDNHKAFLKE